MVCNPTWLIVVCVLGEMVVGLWLGYTWGKDVGLRK